MSFMDGLNSINESKGFGTVCSIGDKVGGVAAGISAIVGIGVSVVKAVRDHKRAKKEIENLNITSDLLKKEKQVTSLELDNRELDALIRRKIMLEQAEKYLTEKELEGTE